MVWNNTEVYIKTPLGIVYDYCTVYGVKSRYIDTPLKWHSVRYSPCSLRLGIGLAIFNTIFIHDLPRGVTGFHLYTFRNKHQESF